MNARKLALAKLTEERMGAIPSLARFTRSANENLALDHDRFWDCLEPLEELLQTSFLADLVNYELGKFAESPLYVPLMSYASQIVILETDLFQLSIGFVNQKTAPKSGRVESLPNHCALVIIDDTPMPVARFEQPKPFPVDDFDRGRGLRLVQEQTWKPREIQRLRAGFDIMEFRPMPERTSVVLNLSSMPFLDFVWEYDAQTLAPVRFVPGNATWSRIDYTAQIMTEINATDCVPTLVRLAHHPAHFLRWRAIRSVVTLDFEQGLRLLQEAAEGDAHPHVRRAARSTLEEFARPVAV